MRYDLNWEPEEGVAMTNVQLYIALGVPTLMALMSIGVNVALYIHLSSTMTARFAGMDTQLGLLMSKVVEVDNRVVRVEERLGIKG
jgi:hypothetical protein